MCHNPFMNPRPLLALAVFCLVSASAARAQPPDAPVKLRYHFVPGQTLRYLVQRDPYFDDPAGAVETTDPDAPYRPPVVERLTEEVLAVGRDGTATVRVTVGPEPGFEDEVNTAKKVNAARPAAQTVTVTPLGQVVSYPALYPVPGFLRAFLRLPFALTRPGLTWRGTTFRGADRVGTSLMLAAQTGGRRGLAVITQALPPAVAESRSPDRDGTLLQTTRSVQSDRIIFDAGVGSLRRQVSTLTVTLSLVMTGRGGRGAADFGHVIPNVQVIQTMTIDRQDDPPAHPLPASTGRRSGS